MNETKWYVYGIVEAEPLRMDVSGVAGAEEVTAVEHQQIAALVSEIETMNPDRSEANVRAHNQVLKQAMDQGCDGTVVPMQFGMVFETKNTIENVLRHGRRAFVQALEQTEGMIELGVKIIAHSDASVDRAAIVASVEDELDRSSETVAQNRMFSDRLLINRSYLVERSNREALDAGIDRLRDRHEDVTIQYSGPWPPYNFVDIQIGASQ